MTTEPTTTFTTPTSAKTSRTAGALRVRRSRGMVNGVLIVLLGLWGALIPLIGPSFDFGYTPDETWAFTDGQWLLEIAPGAAAVLGGLMLIVASDRATGTIGGWVACAGGAWFVIGPVLTPLWDDDGDFLGEPLGATKSGDNSGEIVAEQLALFFGVGLLIVFLAATAAARFSVRGVGDARAVEEAAERNRIVKEHRKAEKQALKDRKRAEKQAAKDASRAEKNTPQPAPEPGLNTPSSGAPLPPHPASEQPPRPVQQPPPGWQPPGGTPRG